MQKLEGELMEISQLIFATNYDEKSLIQAKAAALKAVFYLIKYQRKSNFSNTHNENQTSHVIFLLVKILIKKTYFLEIY